MKPFTVIIPTANRPDFLKTALNSVARQNNLNEIEEVLVSENLGDRSSEEICKQFKDLLPIRYLFQNPQKSNVEHIYGLYKLVETEFTAMLCDDDWWCPSHLHNAHYTLSKSLQASSFFSSNLYVESENSLNASIYNHPYLIQILLDKSKCLDCMILDKQNILSICWLLTPFHLSSMVARTPNLKKALDTIGIPHPWNGDRVLYVGLSVTGDIIYDPIISTYTRSHQGNWMQGKDPNLLLQQQEQGSSKIMEIAEVNNVNLPAIWKDYILEDSSSVRELKEALKCRFSSDWLKKYGFYIVKDNKQNQLASIKNIVKLFLPPIFLMPFRFLKKSRK